jgi:hypothetical protein
MNETGYSWFMVLGGWVISLSGQRHVSFGKAEKTTAFNIWGSRRMESDRETGNEEGT